MDFDEDPLDLLEDDGDGVVEMGLFFDHDGQKGSNQNNSSKGGCCVVLCMLSGSIAAIGFGISRFI